MQQLIRSSLPRKIPVIRDVVRDPSCSIMHNKNPVADPPRLQCRNHPPPGETLPRQVSLDEGVILLSPDDTIGLFMEPDVTPPFPALSH